MYPYPGSSVLVAGQGEVGLVEPAGGRGPAGHEQGVLVPVALIRGVILDHLCTHPREQPGGRPNDRHDELRRVVALYVEEGDEGLVLVSGGGAVALTVDAEVARVEHKLVLGCDVLHVALLGAHLGAVRKLSSPINSIGYFQLLQNQRVLRVGLDAPEDDGLLLLGPVVVCICLEVGVFLMDMFFPDDERSEDEDDDEDVTCRCRRR